MIFNNRCKPILIILSFLFVVFLLQTGTGYAEGNKYTCPMHPHYISDTFGTCPICGMDLVEMEAGTADSDATEDDGLKLPSHMIQRTGVRSKPTEIAYFGRAIRSFGEVVVNQRLQNDVSLRVEGWIEELIVNAEGDEVEPDSLLFRFYSPQLVAAQQDYLTALGSGNTGRLRASEDRLRSLGVQTKVIRQIKSSKKIIRDVPYFAEQKGSIEKISIRQGSYLRPGAIAMRIQGYEKVWIQVNLAEQDISFVKKDSRVNVDFPNLGIHKENVTIDYIAPTVDPATRTAQLRLILPNEKGRIRPGAYVDVTILTDLSPRLAIPYESVLQNKEGNYVIIDRGNGTFQAREIKVGMQYQGLVEVQAGLQEGEQVVVSGQFLIDSESSLRESFLRMEKLSLSLAELEVTDDQLVLLNHLVEGSMYVHEELANQRFPKPEMLDASEQAAQKLTHEVKENRLFFVVEDFLHAIKNRKDIVTNSGWQDLLARTTDALFPWISEGKPRYYKDLGLALFSTEDGRSWIQFAGDIQTPYRSSNGTVQVYEHALDGSGVKTARESQHAQQ
ncbi:efflux RND transporter periplasmic adaptor subunit [Desulforhopalus sp. 52FAK]